jgi:hypothetical protein
VQKTFVQRCTLSASVFAASSFATEIPKFAGRPNARKLQLREGCAVFGGAGTILIYIFQRLMPASRAPARAVFGNPEHQKCPSPCLNLLYAINYLAILSGAALVMIGGADEGNIAGVEAENAVAFQRSLWGLYTWAGLAVFNGILLAHPLGRRFAYDFWCSWTVERCCSRGGHFWRPTPAEVRQREYENGQRNAVPGPAH